MMAIGVAITMAQGQATMSTLSALFTWLVTTKTTAATTRIAG